MSQGGGNKNYMTEIKILHAADLHLDSPFEGLSAGKASIRRAEQRELLGRIADICREERPDLVLLSGDLLDSEHTYFETGEELIRSLGSIDAPVFISPGNHDYYSDKSVYARLQFPDNVHIFKSSDISCVEPEGLNLRVYGAAFTDKRSAPLLEGFKAERSEGIYNVMCIHGDTELRDSPYNYVSRSQLENSDLDYVALGHVHKSGGLKKAGSTWYYWPGCPEGRGFDETGEKSIALVTLSDKGCTVEPRIISTRRYEVLTVDISGADPVLAIHAAISDDTVRDIYRIILTGETELAPDVDKLERALDELFFHLQLRDETRLRRSVWERAGEDTLRGLFLTRLHSQFEQAKDEESRRRIEQAARWGLAALDNMEEVVRHENQ